MYNENSFKHQLFWIKLKQIFYIIVFSIIGSALGVAISTYVVDILLFEQSLKPIIITVSTLTLFFISLLVTSNTGKNVQDGYWKIELLHQLSSISKKLDNLQKLEKLDNLEKFYNLFEKDYSEYLNSLDESTTNKSKKKSTSKTKGKSNSSKKLKTKTDSNTSKNTNLEAVSEEAS